MHDYTLAHLSDAVLLRDLVALVAQDRLTTATLLAHIAEVDARRLNVPAGYASMHAYCVEELRLSEDAASKRIQAARAARQFPALFAALAEGRLHLTAVCLLAPHLTEENAAGLIEGATHRRKFEIEAFLVRQFARRADATSMVQAVVPIPARPVPLPEPAGAPDQHALAHAPQHALAHVEGGRAESAPLSPERYLLKLAIEASTHEKLRYAQALLSHALPTGDLAQVLDRALDALITDLEKRKLGALPGGSRGERRGTGRRPRRACDGPEALRPCARPAGRVGAR